VILVFVLVGYLAVVASIATVNIALPAIRSDFDATPSELQWMVVSFGIAFATVLVIGGRLGDMYGRRRLFGLGIVAFTVASAFSAAAPSIELLTLTRFVAGLAGGMAAPQVVALIRDVFPATERTRAYSLFGVTAGSGFMVGLLLSGALIQVDLFGLGWRSAFLCNVALGAVALVGAVAVMPRHVEHRRWVLDTRGALLIAVGVVCLLYPIIQANELGWSPVIPLALGLAALLFGAFIRHERRLTARGADPLVDLGLFRIGSFRSGLVVTIAYYSMGIPTWFILTIALQSGFGLDPFDTALALAAGPIASIVAASMVPWLARKIGRYTIVLSAVTVTVSILLFCFTLARTGSSTSWLELLPAVTLYGLASGMFTPYAVNITMWEIDSERSGAASGVMQTAQQLASATATAVYGIIFLGLVGNSSSASTNVHAFIVTMTLALATAVVIGWLGWRLKLPAGSAPTAAAQATRRAPAPSPAPRSATSG
jgi:MFS family permease